MLSHHLLHLAIHRQESMQLEGFVSDTEIIPGSLEECLERTTTSTQDHAGGIDWRLYPPGAKGRCKTVALPRCWWPGSSAPPNPMHPRSESNGFSKFETPGRPSAWSTPVTAFPGRTCGPANPGRATTWRSDKGLENPGLRSL